MVRLLISAVLLAAAFSMPIESVSGMLEAPVARHGGCVGKIRRSCPTGSTAPGEIIRGEAEEDGEQSSLREERGWVPAFVEACLADSEGLLPRSDVRAARSVLASGASSARAPPLAA